MKTDEVRGWSILRGTTSTPISKSAKVMFALPFCCEKYQVHILLPKIQLKSR